MGGNKGDRKSYKATSSSKAAEALAAKGGGATGFGGFSGVRPVAGFGFGAPAAAAAAGAASASGDPLELSAQLDGEFAQCLRHMSKRDTTTKMKALQNLKELVPLKTPADLALLLPPWIYQFKKLLLDPSKAVRAEAASIMAAVGTAVGKALLPQLKGLLGPWYLACFDPYPDAAAAAKRSLQEVFPGKKQADALVYCWSEVLTHITSCLAATPQSLGDARKDTPEELEDRYERVIAASLAAAAALLITLQDHVQHQQQQQDSPATAAESTPASAALSEVQSKLQEVLAAPGFLKKHLGSKSVVVRRASYGLVKSLSSVAPLLLSSCVAAAAPVVLGALQDKEPSNHPAMWEMLLAYIHSQQPNCWNYTNMQKAFQPRLLALLRHGCYGSAASSLPALLPLIAMLPRQLPGFQPLLLLDGVLEALWAGLQQCMGSQLGRTATAAAYQELLGWGLRNAAALAAAAAAVDADAPGDNETLDGTDAAARAACERLLLKGSFSSLLDSAIGGAGADAHLASGIVQDVLLAQCSTAVAASAQPDSGQQAAPVQLQVLLTVVGASAQVHLAAAANGHHSRASSETAAAAGSSSSSELVCSRLQQLFNALASCTAPYGQVAAASLASSCCAALLPLLQDGQQLPAASSQLIARLIREYPAAAAAVPEASEGANAATPPASPAAGNSSIAALVRLGIGNCSTGGQLSAADSELLLSCIAGCEDQEFAWGSVLSMLAAAKAADNSCVPGWRFLDALLRNFASSVYFTGAAEPGWSHPQLDSMALHLMQQLASAGKDADGSSNSCWSSVKVQAAAASLLGCCLGANEQQIVLLSAEAAQSAISDMVACLITAQQQQQQPQQPEQVAEAAAQAGAEAAAVCIAALHMALAASSHSSGSGSSGNNASLWHQQPQQISQLLVLLAQLSWGGQLELLLPLAEQYDADPSDEQDGSITRSSSSSTGSASDSDTELEDVTSEEEPEKFDAGAAAAAADSHAPAASDSSRQDALGAVQKAAARVWGAGLLSSALEELPDNAGQQLTRQLQQLLVQGVTDAAAATAGAAVEGTPSTYAASVELGLRWGSRAAVVLVGLDGRREQQQELVQQLLAAAGNWQQWSGSIVDSQAAGSTAGMGLSNGSSHSSLGTAIGDQVAALMAMLSSVLLLQVGCGVLLPLAGTRSSIDHSREATATSSSGSSSSRQRWLLVEILCSGTSLLAAQNTAPGSNAFTAEAIERLVHCVPTAAMAAQQYVLHHAAKSGSRGSAARAVLADTLGALLSGTQAAAAAGSASSAASSSEVCNVYCSTLTSLLQQVVDVLSSQPSALQHLMPALQAFSSEQVAAAASSYMQANSDAAVCSTPAWVLVQVITVLAHAFRFVDEVCISKSGLSRLSVGFVNRATTLDAAVLQQTDSGSRQLHFDLLQLAVACFPIHFDRSQYHTQHTQQQQQQKPHPHIVAKALQPSAGSSTALERQALVALLRHSCSSNSTATPIAGDLLCRLQLRCVSYCWSDMSATEWHIVLRDSQARLSTIRREFERAASTIAGAACAAAQQLTASIASDSIMTPAVAIEVLRKLSRKGLLQRHVAVTHQLVDAAQQAVAGLSLPTLHLGLQLLAVVLQLQQQIQAAGKAPQLDLSLTAAWRELLLTVLGLGAALAIAAGCGPATSTVLMQCVEGQGETWLLLSKCCSAGASQREAVGKVLAVADEQTDMLGVDAVSCCLALLQAPFMQHAGRSHQQLQHHQPYSGVAAVISPRHSLEPLQQIAWELLLHPSSLSSITHATEAAGSKADNVPEYGVNDDAATYLVAVGLRPEMAAVLTTPKPWQVYLLHWALLLAHIAQLGSLKSSVAQRGLTQALRDVPELVPELLERVVGLMGLGTSKKGASAATATEPRAATDDAGHAGAVGGATDAVAVGNTAGLSMSAQVQLSAKLQQLGTGSAAAALAGDVWVFSSALQNIGLPHHYSSWRWLAAAVYRTVLQQLPASARLWFSDLRDRSRIAAVETYTTKFESPALLATEFAAIKRNAGGASGEVGGTCSFKVRASPAAREVTAVLEIEDGATLELQVKLPAAAPLKAAEVECRNKVGIKDGRLRKWLLSIAVFLRNQNQGVLDAISMWKANLEQEFAGVEPCLVCMCVISTVNGQLPRLSCRHCHVSFHPACLYRWFRSSGKSNCVHCQNPW